MLDAFDVMLWALVLPAVMSEFRLDAGQAGQLGSLTLLASAAGGALFGVAADKVGRVPALVASILIYSVFTAATGLAGSVAQLAVFRVALGLGMGGEWASGAALVSETWPAEHRGKALGIVQSAWAVGYAAAAVVTAVVLPVWGWRAVFFVGIAPAVLTLFVRRHVPESPLWLAASARAAPVDRAAFLRGPLLQPTLVLTLMNACTMFAWWGFNLWIPSYLSLPPEAGGIGLSVASMSALIVVMQVGMWLGYITFGFVSDAFGRRRTYVTYLVGAALAVLAFTTADRIVVLVLLGPVVAFLGTGYFSGFGAVTAEIYPTAVRATAQGVTYNIGRVVSALAPFLVGTLADRRGFATAFLLVSVAFVLAAVCWRWIPETRGRVLPR